MTISRCPVTGMSGHTMREKGNSGNICVDTLNLDMLHENSELRNPMSKCLNYAEEFNKLDYEALKVDLYMLMTDSKE